MTKIRTDRNIIVYILFTIITCGIYHYIAVYDWAKDMNRMCEGDGSKTADWLEYFILNLITCGLYSFFWQYQLAERLCFNANKYNLFVRDSGVSILLWNLIGSLVCGIGPLVALHILMRNTNMLAAAYNQANEQFNNNVGFGGNNQFNN